jgi:putative hydrolase of the HAD superfamily
MSTRSSTGCSRPIGSRRDRGGVVFDLFGTLVPEFSTSDFFGSVRDMAHALGADRDRFEGAWRQTAEARQTGVFATVEDNVRHICAELAVDPSDDAVATALDLRLQLYQTWFHPRRGALETLSELKMRRYPIGLVSMCAPDAPSMWRASALAPFVDVEVFSSEVGLRKPDAAIYLRAPTAWVSLPMCLYCGDGATASCRVRRPSA